jgi:pimeloyl-ACP methyl ester carboxylesterase
LFPYTEDIKSHELEKQMKYFFSQKFFFLILLLTITNGSFLDNSTFVKSVSDKHYQDDSLYFNTQFLMNYNLVAKTLIQAENFQEISFITSDSITINGLYREITDAKYTILFCAGFYPGRKEGLATFIKIVPENCNILFFDARGHGKSTGRFFTNIYNYGCDEYKDIIAAIQFVSEKSKKTIIVHGICAGAFHALRALSMLGSEQEKYQIKGFIFDSGITSIAKVTHVPEQYLCDKTIPNLFLSLYPQDTKKEVKQRYLCKISSFFITTGMAALTYLLKPFIKLHDAKINLAHDTHSISCPIFFIHSKNDKYASFEDVLNLANAVKNANYWWIEESEHALHHLKHAVEYKEKLNHFIKAAV